MTQVKAFVRVSSVFTGSLIPWARKLLVVNPRILFFWWKCANQRRGKRGLELASICHWFGADLSSPRVETQCMSVSKYLTEGSKGDADQQTSAVPVHSSSFSFVRGSSKIFPMLAFFLWRRKELSRTTPLGTERYRAMLDVSSEACQIAVPYFDPHDH